MYSIEKNIVKNLAVSEEVANIAMPKPRIARNISTYKRDWAYSPLHFCYRSCEVLANLRGVRSLFTYIKLVFNKCQNLTQAVTRGIIVPVLHPYLNGTSVFRTCSAICGTFRSNRKKLSTKYHSVRMCAATRRFWARLGWNTCILSKPCTRSSRWDLPLQMSRTAITRYSSMPAPSKSANFRIFGSLCSVLA